MIGNDLSVIIFRHIKKNIQYNQDDIFLQLYNMYNISKDTTELYINHLIKNGYIGYLHNKFIIYNELIRNE